MNRESGLHESSRESPSSGNGRHQAAWASYEDVATEIGTMDFISWGPIA